MPKSVISKLKDLIPDDRNANKHSEYGMQRLEKGLRENGLGRSILISSYNKIIAGNGVTESAGAIGIENLRIIETDGKEIIAVKRTDIKSGTKEFYQMALSDNIIAKENIIMDAEVVDAICEDYEIEEWKSKEVTEAVEDDFDGVAPKEPITVLGDLYEIGVHRLLCGDSIDSDSVAKLMNGEKADLVFTDPPYGVSYTGGHNKKKREGIENDELEGNDLTNLFRDSLLNADLFSKDHSAFYIWFSTNKAKETFLSFSELNLEVRAILCWYKIKSGLGAFMAQYIPNFEPCIYAFKVGKAPQWFGPSDEKSVWELKKDQRNDYHPTQKPIELPERAINNSSKVGQIVLDLFLGSGSTMVASHQLNRKCYGMELDPKYCDVIVSRMIKLDGTLSIKRNGKLLSKEELAAFTANTEAK